MNRMTDLGPVLPRLKRLNLNLCTCTGSHGITVIIWLLLAPNVRRLILKEMTINDQMKLATDLGDLLNTYQFLKSICNDVNQVELSYDSATNNPEIQQKLFLHFSEVFQKATGSLKKTIFPIVSKISSLPKSLACPLR